LFRPRLLKAAKDVPMRDDTHEILGDEPKLLTPSQAARVLRRSTRSLRRWEQLGLIRAVRPAGGAPLYPRAELERLLREGTR
jgi:hypothetical protein